MIIPTIMYENAAVAIDWLCNAFGFEKHLVVPLEDGSIAHAQLKLNDDWIMVSSYKETTTTKYNKLPKDIGGMNTQSCYIVVNNIEEHYEQAKKAGAAIHLELVMQEYGGKVYTCLDPEGFIWHFGSYDPRTM